MCLIFCGDRSSIFRVNMKMIGSLLDLFGGIPFFRQTRQCGLLCEHDMSVFFFLRNDCGFDEYLKYCAKEIVGFSITQ